MLQSVIKLLVSSNCRQSAGGESVIYGITMGAESKRKPALLEVSVFNTASFEG